MDRHINSMPEENQQCPYCGSNNTEYSDGQEYRKNFWVYDYYCHNCFKSFGLIFPKTKEE